MKSQKKKKKKEVKSQPWTTREVPSDLFLFLQKGRSHRFRKLVLSHKPRDTRWPLPPVLWSGHVAENLALETPEVKLRRVQAPGCFWLKA